jgi:hypothetical protein
MEAAEGSSREGERWLESSSSSSTELELELERQREIVVEGDRRLESQRSNFGKFRMHLAVHDAKNSLTAFKSDSVR